MDPSDACQPIRSRFPRGLLKRLDDVAGREDRSRAKMLMILVREALDARERQAA